MSIIIFDSRFAEIGADGGAATAKVAGFTRVGARIYQWLWKPAPSPEVVVSCPA